MLNEEQKKKIDKIIILNDFEYWTDRVVSILSVITFVAMFATVGAAMVGCIIFLASKQTIVMPFKAILIASVVCAIIFVISRIVHNTLEKIGAQRGQELLK